jgi:predicted alternative tryptophan synthase beta-subunit
MTIDSADAAATKILLSESEMPRRWYNLVADLPAPPPPVLHPGTRQPVGPDDLRPLFPMALVILTALCGHGLLDLPAYGHFLAGDMVDRELSDEALAAAMAALPVVPA